MSHRGSTVDAMDPDDHAMLEALARHGRRGEIHDFLAQGDRCGLSVATRKSALMAMKSPH